MSKVRKRQSKAVTIAYTSIAAVLLLIIAAVALVIVPPSPPQVAEFAPQAVDQIVQAPNQQSSQFGTGAGGACAVGQICGGQDANAAAPLKKVIEKARVRRCVGDPPRQIEDPQSPPCVNYFDGDNGGATTRGVTRDEIRYAVQQYLEVTPEILAGFFNKRFELYGRKIRVITYPYVGSSGPEADRATVEAAHEAEAFAVAVPPLRSEGFQREASRLKLLALTEQAESNADLSRLHPYVWNYLPTFQEILTHASEFACKSLVGKVARYGGPAYIAATRSFAVLQLKGTAGTHQGDTSPLVEDLQNCGAEVIRVEYKNDPLGQEADNQVVMADLQQQGVTTLIPDMEASGLMNHASRLGYQPEWFLPGTGFQLREFNWQRSPADQTHHMFGLAIGNKGLPQADQPWYWAFKEMGASPQSDTLDDFSNSSAYHQVLVLASGIQAAGPNLTPQTFARGLQSLKFPNPGAGAPPYYQGSVSFAGDHSMIDDVGLVWWSESAPAYSSRVSEVGGWCYVDLGIRWRLGQWRKGDHPLFDRTGPCR